MRARTLPAIVLVSPWLLASCWDGASSSPSGVATVTLAVSGEAFRVGLTTPPQLTAARAAQAGGPARIPIGRIVTGAQVNAGWTWHLEDVSFVEVAIELCDGRPSDVERQGPAFGGGRFCPWSAAIIGIQEE